MKSHLVFDTTNSGTILDSDSVGAFVRANDGTLITKHTTAKATASVVYDTVTFTAVNAGSAGNSIALVFDGIDDVATVVGAWNLANPSNTVGYSGLGTYVPAAGTAQLAGGTDNQGLDVYMLNPSMVVTATDLDIRNLSASTDSVDSWLNDGSGNAITSTGGALDINVKSGNLIVDLNGIYNSSSNPTPDNVGAIFFTRAVTPGLAEQVQKVTAAALGTVVVADASKIHALDVNSFLYAKDGTSGDLKQLTMDATNGGLDVNIKNTLSVNDVALANGSIISNAVTAVGSVVASILPARKYLYIFNNGNKAAYIGTTGVTTSNGYPVHPGSEIQLRAGANIDVKFAQASGSTIDVRSLELA